MRIADIRVPSDVEVGITTCVIVIARSVFADGYRRRCFDGKQRVVAQFHTKLDVVVVLHVEGQEVGAHMCRKTVAVQIDECIHRAGTYFFVAKSVDRKGLDYRRAVGGIVAVKSPLRGSINAKRCQKE